jgi:hypothetical protein
MIREHGYFLKKLIENDRAKNINLHYSINLTSLPDEFINMWKNFKNVRLHLSIDDIGERNDYIRYGAKWNVIMENFEKIIQYRDIFRLEVCQTVSCLNVYNIDNFKEFFNKYGIIIAHNYVHHPTFQHVSILPRHIKDEIINNIKHLREDEKNRLISELNKDVDEKHLNKFISFITLLDKKRNIKIGDFLKEWNNI